MRLVIDGVFFSLAQSGISRVWKSVLPHLMNMPGLEVTFLDRGNAPRIDGLTRLPFPSYKDFYNPEDSALLQQVCDHLRADVFASTYYTTPLRTPAFLLVHDMIPERLGFDLADRHWQERAIAISFARKFLAVSENTRRDLIAFYPEVEQDVTVAHCGVDPAVFGAPEEGEVAAFLQKHGLSRDYVLLVGSREQHLGYKNSKLLFQAMSLLPEAGFDIVAVGGEREFRPEYLEMLPAGASAKRIDLPDEDMGAAYGGALALVYPSLYEGFGLPVAEAMACGCPVITTRLGSLGEVAGDAARIVDGYSPEVLAQALADVQEERERSRLREAGLRQSLRFRWEAMAAAMKDVAEAAMAAGQTEAYRRFADEWSALRLRQAEVDTRTWRR